VARIGAARIGAAHIGAAHIGAAHIGAARWWIMVPASRLDRRNTQ
jgi:hypothetical protein